MSSSPRGLAHKANIPFKCVRMFNTFTVSLHISTYLELLKEYMALLNAVKYPTYRLQGIYIADCNYDNK